MILVRDIDNSRMNEPLVTLRHIEQSSSARRKEPFVAIGSKEVRVYRMQIKGYLAYMQTMRSHVQHRPFSYKVRTDRMSTVDQRKNVILFHQFAHPLKGEPHTWYGGDRVKDT